MEYVKFYVNFNAKKMLTKKIKNFKTLDRITSSNLDELKMALVTIQSQEDNLKSQKAILEAREQAERTLVSKDPQKAQTFTAFIQLAQTKRLELDENLRELEEQKEILLDQIRQNFQDQKKWQTMLEKEYVHLKFVETKTEQKNLDQLAERRHKQKNNNF